MPLLKNQKHERFAQIVATGASATDAYRKVYKATVKVSGPNGHRLLKNAKIQQRLAELQQKAETNTVLTLQEKREFLRRIVVTPVEKVKDTDLHQGFTKGGAPTMPCKLKAIELDAKLAGEFKEKVEVSVDGLGELLKMIRGGK